MNDGADVTGTSFPMTLVSLCGLFNKASNITKGHFVSLTPFQK